jgi:hypothetical protein
VIGETTRVADRCYSMTAIGTKQQVRELANQPASTSSLRALLRNAWEALRMVKVSPDKVVPQLPKRPCLSHDPRKFRAVSSALLLAASFEE